MINVDEITIFKNKIYFFLKNGFLFENLKVKLNIFYTTDLYE